MLVEPTPIRPSSRAGRLAAIIFVVGPIVAIVWPAVGARTDGTTPAPTDSRGSLALPSARPLASAAVNDAAPGGFPSSAFGLPVRTVSESLEARGVGDVVDGLVAVSGFLSRDPNVADCLGLPVDSAETFCRRSAILEDDPDPGRPISPGARGGPRTPEPRLDAQFPPGTALVAALRPRGSLRTPSVVPLRVVLIGRLGGLSGSCEAAFVGCRTELVVERLAWASGEWREGVVAADPTLAPEASVIPVRLGQMIASREADRGEAILAKSILGVGLLRAIDPTAADAIGSDVAGPVWYLRSVANPRFGDGQRLVAWVVIDHASGLILATGPPASD